MFPEGATSRHKINNLVGMEGMELVKDRDLDESEETNTIVGGTRVELWLKGCVDPRIRSKDGEPG